MKEGMNSADAAIKAVSSALPMDAQNQETTTTMAAAMTDKNSTMAAKSAASTIIGSSFLAVAGVAVSFVFFA